MDTIVGLYDHSNARKAIEVLASYGVDQDHISVVARDSDITGPRTATRSDFESPGLAGFLSELGAFSFTAPEIGPVIATGPLGVKLFTTLETRAASSLLSALVNAGFSQQQAELYVEGVRQGNLVLTVESGLQDESRSTVHETERVHD